MFGGLRRYDDYTSAESPWIDKVPAGWRMERVKSLLAERVAKGFPEEPLLAATQSHGVIRKSDYGSRTVTATKDLHLLKLVEVGDFVISLRSFQGGIERCYHRGIISPAYTVLTAKSDSYRDFLTHLFKTKPFVGSLTLAVTGIREGQNIDYSKLSVELLPVPPADEQAAIVKYLAHANARIDMAIAAKRRLIALLIQARKAVIDELVVGADRADRGPSSAPWLGSMPSGWEWRRCRTMTSLVTSGSRGWAEYYSDSGPMFLQSGNLGRDLGLKLDNVQRVNLPASLEGLRTRVQASDLLVCITGALTGNVALVPDDWAQEAYVNQHVALVRTRDSAVFAPFLAYSFASATSQLQFKGSEYGGTKKGLGLDEVKNVEVLLPPRREQIAIVDQIRRRTAQLDRLAARARYEVELLNEFRTRLVADVVTGQVDVRGIAASLPDIDQSVNWGDFDSADALELADFDDVIEASEV